MKIAVYANDRISSQKVKDQLLQKIKNSTLILDELNPEIVLTIGGDGTVLAAVHHYLECLESVKFIGIHTGHLGYYTDWLPNELDELLEFLQKEELKVNRYPLLSITLCTSQKQDQLYALNEMTILNASRTQHLNINIDDLFFESFRGTGVCLATPTGSTAYNKSLGGAILYPTLDAFQMTEIASINNNVYRTIGSPLIIPKEQTVIIHSENFEDITITRDHLSSTYQKLKAIKITLANRHVLFVKRKHVLFWDRVKHHFL